MVEASDKDAVKNPPLSNIEQEVWWKFIPGVAPVKQLLQKEPC